MSDTQQPLDMPTPITLSIGQWRVVLETLANGPFRLVAPLIGAIEQQANAHIQRMQRGNGAMIEERHDAS